MNKSMLSQLTTVVAVTWLACGLLPALGQTPVISSISQNGLLVCTNLQSGTTASVEWASSALGPWTNNWASLASVTADSNGTIRVSVPMFYRVRGVPAPAFALIPAGSFTMGETLGYDNELPLHTNYVSAFYMEKCEITKWLWDDVYRWATNHGYAFDSAGLGKAPNHPVHTVYWYDVVKWCNARSEKEGRPPAYYTDAALTRVYRTGRVDVQNDWVNWNAGYRLPTEAEWEKAARGGASGHRFPWSDTDSITQGRANYYIPHDTSPTRGYHPTFNDGVQPYTSPTGYFAPNDYGLYDMAGNVCQRRRERDAKAAVGNGSGPLRRRSHQRRSRMVYPGLWFCELPGLGKGEEGRRVPGELSEENGHEVDPFLTARFVSIRLRRWQMSLSGVGTGMDSTTAPRKKTHADPLQAMNAFRAAETGSTVKRNAGWPTASAGIRWSQPSRSGSAAFYPHSSHKHEWPAGKFSFHSWSGGVLVEGKPAPCKSKPWFPTTAREPR